MVYIIILNWNGWRDTIECIRSCQKLTYPHFEILVVDNGSEDGSIEELRKIFPTLQILKVGKNLGFAGGNNIGIKNALEKGANYVWLLNNDTVVDPSALSFLVEEAESKSDIGIIGSKILLYKHPDTIHFAGGKVDFETGLTRHLGVFEKDLGQYDDLYVVDYVTGCSLLIKTSVIRKIGLMTETYFLYYEETDWCMQATKAGYIIYLSQKSKVFHKVSKSIGYFSPEKQYYIVRNRLYFLKRHGVEISWLKRIKEDSVQVFSLIKVGKFRHAMMMVKGYIHWCMGYAGDMHELVKIYNINKEAT